MAFRHKQIHVIPDVCFIGQRIQITVRKQSITP